VEDVGEVGAGRDAELALLDDRVAGEIRDERQRRQRGKTPSAQTASMYSGIPGYLVVSRHSATSVTGAHAATADTAEERAAPSKATWPPCEISRSPMRGAHRG
jgi:hypothetical protein